MSESISRMQSSRQVLCLQCEKAVAPSATLAIVVRDENDNVVGYLHRLGTCKAEWHKAHPSPPAADEKPIRMKCYHCDRAFTLFYSETDHGSGRCPNCGHRFGQSDVITASDTVARR
jgi:hypothetical protein